MKAATAAVINNDKLHAPYKNLTLGIIPCSQITENNIEGGKSRKSPALLPICLGRSFAGL